MTEAFDDLVAMADPTVAIVTTVAGDDRAGCVVGFLAQCGIDPPRFAIWLSKANRTHRIGFAAEHFAVHWIPADRHDLAELFGGNTGDEVDKFARCDWTPGPGGVPLLDGCGDRFVGRRHAWLDVDVDHCCIVLEPVEVHRTDGAAPQVLRLSDVTDIDAGHSSDDTQEAQA